jgi:hypothetical protein
MRRTSGSRQVSRYEGRSADDTQLPKWILRLQFSGAGCAGAATNLLDELPLIATWKPIEWGKLVIFWDVFAIGERFIQTPELGKRIGAEHEIKRCEPVFVIKLTRPGQIVDCTRVIPERSIGLRPSRI